MGVSAQRYCRGSWQPPSIRCPKWSWIVVEPHVVLCDIDGVVWLAHRPLPGSADAVARLRSRGIRVAFVTNNSYATVGEQEHHLSQIGIPAHGDVLTSAMAAASLTKPSWNVLICGGPGLSEAVERAGATAISMDDVDAGADGLDAVVVGFHRSFDYESLRRASAAIRHGAVFIASNEDATYPTPQGPIPGGGSIVAAVATASSTRPIVAGKPHPAMADLVRSVVPDVDGSAFMVGDRPSTDGVFARRLGCRFALVHSDVSRDEIRAGKTRRSEEGEAPVAIDLEGGSLREVVEKVLGIP